MEWSVYQDTPYCFLFLFVPMRLECDVEDRFSRSSSMGYVHLDLKNLAE
jgi:hypothetical protein